MPPDKDAKTTAYFTAIGTHHPPEIYPKHADITVYRSEIGPDGKPALPKNVEMDGIDTDVSSAVPLSNIQKFISTFVHESVYSPVRLANELGWEPTPRGYTPTSSFALDGTSPLDAIRPNGVVDQKPIFGWLDAFEDLVRINSGLELSDLDKKHAQVHNAWAGFGKGFPSPTDFSTLRHVRNMIFHMNMWMKHSWFLWFPSFTKKGKTTPQTLQEWIDVRKWAAEREATIGPLEELKRQHERLDKLTRMDLDSVLKAHHVRGLTDRVHPDLAADKDGLGFLKALSLALPALNYILESPDREDQGESQEQARAKGGISAAPATKQEWNDAVSRRPPILYRIFQTIHWHTKNPLGHGRDLQLLQDQGRVLKADRAAAILPVGGISLTEVHFKDYLGTIHREVRAKIEDKTLESPSVEFLCRHFSTKKITREQGDAIFRRKLQESWAKMSER
ncbi:hypothetical protein QBC40DRAFT_285575 [Triangularia verruculosa]|uniref:Uncharacterized protein n=1 Tax=Triangularia verruculosa TaxID=2587418 RepID=A0AAN6XB31_9PEZI|nr:hypothetical protein QBC40DRAFT_285575 [Triangularia verruculosa]